MTITTPTMGLQKPEVSITDGPAWATALNASLDTIDTHDHSVGNGSKITPSGLNINNNLSFNSYLATNAGGYQFALSAAPTENNLLYLDTSGNLRYKNAMGDFQLINAMGEVTGGFTGDYTSTDAEANYNDGLKTYRFWQEAGITANVDVGTINIYENIASANSVSLQSPTSLASSYTLTLPTALAGSNNLPIISSTAGVLSYNDQSVTSTSNPTFATVNTGQGDNELYPMDQAVRTTDAVTFATVDTGQGANELYAMNQNVRTTDSVTFVDVSATLNSVDYSALTQAEINQIANIGATTISATQWGYLGALNQGVATTDSVTFNNVSATLNSIDYSSLTQTEVNQIANINAVTISNTQWGYLGNLDQSLTTASAVTFATLNTGQGANELYAMDQNVRSTDSVDFENLDLTATTADQILLELFAQTTTSTIRQYFYNSDSSRNFNLSAFFGSGTEVLNLQADNRTFMQFNRDGEINVSTSNTLSGLLVNGTVASPAVTPNAGSSVTTFKQKYMRVGATVTISGAVQVTTDGSGEVDLEIALPVTTNFVTSEDLDGSTALRLVTSPGTPILMNSAVFADASSNRMALVVHTANASTAIQIRYVATYQVI